MSIHPGYVRHFLACNAHDMTKFLPLRVGSKNYGFVTKKTAELLSNQFDFFKLSSEAACLIFPDNTFQGRSQALAKATEFLSRIYAKPLRSEMYPVVESFGAEPIAEIDRTAVPWFGVRAWGVHVNGFVKKEKGIYLWVGKRAASRQADPGKLDNMIGGGHPIGLTLEENLCKEAQEEAGISKAMALTARQVRTIDYKLERNYGISRDTLFVYDLALPEDFEPRNTDGEVASFDLMALPEVAKIVRTTDLFKFNCNLVVIDFLMRHGVIGPECEEYQALVDALGQAPASTS